MNTLVVVAKFYASSETGKDESETEADTEKLERRRKELQMAANHAFARLIKATYGTDSSPLTSAVGRPRFRRQRLSCGRLA